MVQEQVYSGRCRVHGHVNNRGQKDDSQGRIDFVHDLDDVVWRGRRGGLVIGQVRYLSELRYGMRVYALYLVYLQQWHPRPISQRHEDHCIRNIRNTLSGHCKS